MQTEYIKTEDLYEDFIVVYCRVSSAQQDLKTQIRLAEAYVNSNKIDKDKVKWLEDDNISANKLSMDDRPKLQELRMLIKQKKVKTVIVYSRDRLARNFYEYVALVKEFYQYGVKVIFTATGQPPFSMKLSIEALFGIFAQAEGKSIVGRRSDTTKQFPSSAFGFDRTGEKKEVKFIPNPEIENDLKSFFYAVVNVEKADDLFDVFMKYKKVLKNKPYSDLLRYLKNPFYAAHMKTLYGYERLHHVEQIISLEDYLDIQDVLKNLQDELFNAMTLASDHGIIIPQCSICKTNMKFRATELGKSGYYVCQKKHKKIVINVDEYNELITKQLNNIIGSISEDAIKKCLFAHLKLLETENEQKIVILNRKLYAVHKKITEKYLPKLNTNFESLIHEARNIKDQLKQIHIELIKIQEARKGINGHVQIIKKKISEEILGYDLYFLCTLFYRKIEVSPDSLIYHVPFGRFIESGDNNEPNS